MGLVNFIDTCGDNEWMCKNKRCIDKYDKCNSLDDCGDNSDEDKELCKVRPL